MRRVLAIARMTFAEGIRMRIVLVFLIVLVLLVLRMPFALRGDETLSGRLQNFLSYSLGALGFLLSLATVFFSCATLANELKERSLHLVVTKPVSRFQILLGKWIGVNLLNVLILLLCGATIYGFACFLRSRTPVNERDRLLLRDAVWTSRVAARPTVPRDMLMNAATEDVKALIANGELDPGRQRLATLERFEARVKDWRVVPPGGYRVYEFSGLSPPEREDTVIQVRFKLIAQPLPPGELGVVAWTFVDPDTGAPLGETRVTRERSNETHQFLFRGAPAVRGGRASLVVEAPYDPDRPTYLIFDGEDSLQLLYRVGGFGLNFVRALLLVFLRLALLSAIGVFFSVFVSFPVACLCTAAFFIICLGYPFWVESMGSVEAHDAPEFDPYGPLGPAVRVLLAPLIRYAFPNFSAYDGGQALVDGEYVSYGLLARCAAHTLLYGGLLLLGPGWMIFRSREVAEVQV